MLQLLLCLASFTLGFTVGLQISFIVRELKRTIERVETKNRVKNSGVVKMGLNGAPPLNAVTSTRHGVVRPKAPQEDKITEETNTTLSRVRARVS